MNTWETQWFAAGATAGGVVRRSRTDVNKYSSIAAVVAIAQANGWHVIETGGQVVVLCNPGAMTIYT